MNEQHKPDEQHLSRRDILKGAIMTGVTAAGLSSTAQAQDAFDGYIDAHSHVWTPDIEAYPLASGKTIEDLKPRSFTPEELLALANPLGVQRVVLIQHTQFHVFDNRYIVDVMKKFPGRFSAVACIDSLGSNIPETMLSLKKQGVRGFRIREVDGGNFTWSSSGGMQKMWKVAAEQNLAMCPLINPAYLPEVDRMCGLNPETTCVIDHFGRVGIDGTIHEADLKNLVKLAKHKHTYVKVSAFYALGKKQPPHTELIPMIRALCDAFGPERLMWASDCPYQLNGPNTYADSLKLVKDGIAFLSEKDKQWLLKGTAEKVFFS